MIMTMIVIMVIIAVFNVVVIVVRTAVVLLTEKQIRCDDKFQSLPLMTGMKSDRRVTL
jgi:hypothetical protein